MTARNIFMFSRGRKSKWKFRSNKVPSWRLFGADVRQLFVSTPQNVEVAQACITLGNQTLGALLFGNVHPGFIHLFFHLLKMLFLVSLVGFKGNYQYWTHVYFLQVA